MLTLSIFVLSLKILHIGINSKPTFSYVVITLSSQKFEFEKKVSEKMINLIIKSAEPPKTWIEKDKFIKDINVSEIKEKDKISTLISIFPEKNTKWYITAIGNSILVFVGKEIPFEEKEDIEQYMISAVETKNYGAIDILFDFSKSTDPKIRAKALYYLGEMFFKMGKETREGTTILKSANYYSNAAKEFYDLGEIKLAAESKYKSSKAFRIIRFFPEAKFQAELGLKFLQDTQGYEEQKIKLKCSKALALVGMNKAGEAFLEIGGLRPQNISGEAFDCYWAAKGVVEYEKGEFEKAGEYISYVSDNFIKEDPVVLPRYTKTLIKTGRTFLARKYIGFMINSFLSGMKPEGYLLLSETLLIDGDLKNSLKFIYKVLREYPGTKWEIKARLFAVLHKDQYSKIINEIPRNEIPKDDPVMNPVSNLRFIISSFRIPESQIALKEYLQIISEKIEKGKSVDEDIEFLRKVLPTLKAFRTAPDILSEISNRMYEVLEGLYNRGEKIKAFAFYTEHKDLFPLFKDYSFINEIYKEFEGEKLVEIERIKELAEKGNCLEAYKKTQKLKNLTEEERSTLILKIALCFLKKNDPKFEEICQKEKIKELESVCFPKTEKVEEISREIIEEYQKTIKEIKKKAGEK